jgi:DNA-binding transcriptional ArsR family regulator
MGEEGRDPLEALGGTALRVYLYLLLARRPVGVRELQRRMGFSSPSTARHHLERLTALGLAVKTPEGYRAVPPRRGLLRLFVATRGRLVPVSLAAAAFTAAATAAYLLLPGCRDPAAVAALLASSAAQLLAARQALRAARELEELITGRGEGENRRGR